MVLQHGFIKLHRKIQDHWIYQEQRKFSRYEAWLDMLMMANHKDNKFVLGNELVEVEKGSFITSELKLMERWDWGKEKVRTFLKLLEKDGMIIKKSDRKKTTITICNYCVYHSFENEVRPQTDREQTASRPSADTNKNVKNVKNEKNNNFSSINDPQFKNVIDFYQSNLQKGISETPANHELIIQWFEEWGVDLLLAAMKVAAKAEAKGVNFLEGILKNWKDAGVKDLESARRFQKDFKSRSKRSGYANKQPTRSEYIPDWYNEQENKAPVQPTEDVLAKKRAVEEKLNKYKKEPEKQ